MVSLAPSTTTITIVRSADALPAAFRFLFKNKLFIKKCAEHLLQSAVGVIFGEDGKMLYTDNYAEQLTRWGYEKMVLPKVDRAVQVTQPYTSFLSLFGLVYRTYGIMKQYIEHLTLEELESKLARKKFDSDEEDSESEVDATEEEGKEETEEKEEKKNIRT
uniref:RING-type E3 ubiquitin transferase n=1 Tax=Heterorhabditis bacteriophora TaxID=37862 RepID=A0A1I7WRN1_HETBA